MASISNINVNDAFFLDNLETNLDASSYLLQVDSQNRVSKRPLTSGSAASTNNPTFTGMLTTDNLDVSAGSVRFQNLPSKTTETDMIYIDGSGNLRQGVNTDIISTNCTADYIDDSLDTVTISFNGTLYESTSSYSVLILPKFESFGYLGPSIKLLLTFTTNLTKLPIYAVKVFIILDAHVLSVGNNYNTKLNGYAELATNGNISIYLNQEVNPANAIQYTINQQIVFVYN